MKNGYNWEYILFSDKPKWSMMTGENPPVESGVQTLQFWTTAVVAPRRSSGARPDGVYIN